MTFDKKIFLVFIIFSTMFLSFLFLSGERESFSNSNGLEKEKEEKISLPEIKTIGDVSIEEAISSRRSVRSYKDESLSLEKISQLLWSGQGITEKDTGKRSAPSAGATYPLELYLVVKDAKELEPGVYHYLPDENSLVKVFEGDAYSDLKMAALGQSQVEEAAINLVISALYERTMNHYGERGRRYVHMEAGHVSQNLYLQAQSLNLGTVAIGAFNEKKIKKILKLPENEKPLYIMPVGKPH